MNPRQAAVDILLRVIKNGEHLTTAISRVERTIPGTQNQAFTKELCFGVLRWMPRLEAILGRLMERPLRNKDLDVRLILLLGIYQLLYTRVPPYAAVAESVSLAQKRKKGWARGLINGVLRHLQREWGEIAPALESQAGFTFSHPEWLIQAIRTAWPVNWQEILEQNNRHPPLTLRVNNRNLNRDRYLEILQQEGFPAQPTSHSADGIRLIQATAVEKLPRFAQGAVSVQDEAAQLTSSLLATQPGQRVLDACAAPGGKTAHILETTQDLKELVALDQDPRRLDRLKENLIRLGLTATVLEGDATEPSRWWDGIPFDRILIDAPCSATGVIRRHPDIKFLRQEEQFPMLTQQQDHILRALWPLLAPGGTLLYATCSIIPRENESRIALLLSLFRDAKVVPITAKWGQQRKFGRQILPGEDEMDGFYYALLRKGDG